MNLNNGNTISLRLLNLSKVLNLVYENGSLTQADIKEKSNLSGPTVIQCIQLFKEKGIFCEGKALASSGGRKPTLICFNYNYRYAVGVEIRTHHIDIAIMNLKGECVASKTYRIIFEQSFEYVKKISSLVNQIIEENIEIEKVIGVSVAFPGEISLDGKEITRSTVFNLHNVNLNKYITGFNCPVEVVYGPNAAGFGAVFKDKDLSDLVYIVVTENGIAGSIVANKKIYNGKSGKAGAFGHIQIDSNGKLCSCGRKGCWSACCSINSLIGDEDNKLKDFFERVDGNDLDAKKSLEKYLDYMAQGIANVHLSFDTDVVIGGKIVPYLLQYENILKEKVLSYPVLKDEKFDIRFDTSSNSPMSEGAAIMMIAKYLEGDIFTE